METFVNEISLLKRLRGQRNIITLIDAEIRKDAESIFLILEYGETDLHRLLQQQKNRTNYNYYRLWWQQMLEAVHTIHEGS